MRYLRLSSCSCFIGAMLLAGAALNAQPTDNAVETRYGSDAYPWAADIKWSTVQTTAATANDDGDDLAVVQAEINSLSASGGGVLFFPAGTYNFSDDLVVADGVILRGANPTNPDATDMAYDPPTNFEFPKFAYVGLTPTEIAGFNASQREAAVNAAFKSIVVEDVTSASNLGVVNIDINRATIDFLGTPAGLNFNDDSSAFGSADQLDLGNENIVIMGNRINNGVLADPGVPSGFQNAWQVWTNRFTFRIRTYALRNTLVSANRINDAAYQEQVLGNNSFPVSNDVVVYARGASTDLGSPNVYLDTVAQPRTTVADTTFYDQDIRMEFATGYGIVVNRFEAPYDTDKTPVNAPQYYYPGMTVRDNWIFTTTRVKIQIAGENPVAKGNVIVDQPNKFLTVTETGLNWYAAGRANDNIAIEMTGVGGLIEDNTWTINPTQGGAPGAWSDWGIGIRYLGGEGDPTQLYGLTIRNNTGTTDVPEGNKSSGVEIANVNYIGDLEISGNEFLNGGNIAVVGSANMAMRNAKINNNTVREGTDGFDGNITAAIGWVIGENSEITGNTVDGSISLNNSVLDGGFNLPSDPASSPFVNGNTVGGTVSFEDFSVLAPSGANVPGDNFVDFRPTIELVNESAVVDLANLTPGASVEVQVRVTLDEFGVGTAVNTVAFYDGVISSDSLPPAPGEGEDPAPNTVPIILTDPDEDGIYTGTWTVPTEVNSIRPWIRVQLDAVNVKVPEGLFDADASYTEQAFLFPTVVGATGGTGPTPVLVVLEPELINNDTQITITFDDQAGIAYRLQTSSDLVSWDDVAGTEITGDGGTQTYTIDVDGTRGIYRVVID